MNVVLTLAVARSHESIHERVLATIIRPPLAASEDWQTIDMPLNHFDALESTPWTMRYWVDRKYWNNRTTSPVFLQMGGEGAQGAPGGQMRELAEAHNALMFSIEHRYYGESIPTKDFSTANLQWLGSAQALADAAFFQNAMVDRFALASEARWVTFGGSYSGELAAWARIKYPHLFFAAVASSAPVTASVDYDGYDKVVADALFNSDVGGSRACQDAVAQAFGELQTRFDDAAKRAGLEKTFNTCGEIAHDGDAYLLHDFVSDDFMGLVQYNDDGAAVSIRTRCADMLNAKLGADPFARLVAITQQRAAALKLTCINDPDPSGVVDSISFIEHLAGYANASNAARAFPYQMCVDGVGHDQTCKPEKGCIFSPIANRTFFQQQCDAAFGVTQRQTDVAVLFNSVSYGDATPGSSRILFVNGGIDPFQAGSVLANTSALLARDIFALLVPGASHCQDMGASAPSDSPSMQVRCSFFCLLNSFCLLIYSFVCSFFCLFTTMRHAIDAGGEARQGGDPRNVARVALGDGARTCASGASRAGAARAAVRRGNGRESVS